MPSTTPPMIETNEVKKIATDVMDGPVTCSTSRPDLVNDFPPLTRPLRACRDAPIATFCPAYCRWRGPASPANGRSRKARSLNGRSDPGSSASLRQRRTRCRHRRRRPRRRGDLIVAASLCSAEKMAFIIRHTSGIVCAPITTEDARRLRLDPMVAHNESNHTTAFTVSIDYKPDGGTGISADEACVLLPRARQSERRRQ